MKNVSGRPSKLCPALVLIVVATLTALTFMYLFMNSGNRPSPQVSRGLVNAHEEPGVGAPIEKLNEENIYTPAPTAIPAAQEPKDTPEPTRAEQAQTPAVPSVDPIVEGQME